MTTIYSMHNIGIFLHDHIIFSFIHRLNMELDLLKFIWAPAILTGRDPATPFSRRIWAHIRGRYWSAKIDDIFDPLASSVSRASRQILLDCCACRQRACVGTGSWIWFFPSRIPRIRCQKNSGSAAKNLSNLSQKIVSKLSAGSGSWLFSPLNFNTI